MLSMAKLIMHRHVRISLSFRLYVALADLVPSRSFPPLFDIFRLRFEFTIWDHRLRHLRYALTRCRCR